MTIQEELMREIIETLKGFTIVVAVMLACMYLMFVVVAFYILVIERKKHKTNPRRTSADKEEDSTKI